MARVQNVSGRKEMEQDGDCGQAGRLCGVEGHIAWWVEPHSMYDPCRTSALGLIHSTSLYSFICFFHFPACLCSVHVWRHMSTCVCVYVQTLGCSGIINYFPTVSEAGSLSQTPSP